jgi:predicted transcriptional regulator of viral defense system
LTLYRLKKKGRIVSPRRDFFVIVPREYQVAGSPPASWFIDDLMRHLGRECYVALLSAAAMHGAGHQQPMAFQIIADAVERNIEVGRVRIEFHLSSLMDGVSTMNVQTETGEMKVATPATTAFDLMRFPEASGYWSNIATVLSELAEMLVPEALAQQASRVARTDVQRLGWLLQRIGEFELADALWEFLEGQRLQPTPLTGGKSISSSALDRRWYILVNDEVELDLLSGDSQAPRGKGAMTGSKQSKGVYLKVQDEQL